MIELLLRRGADIALLNKVGEGCRHAAPAELPSQARRQQLLLLLLLSSYGTVSTCLLRRSVSERWISPSRIATYG
jgi:hypothetical protein